MKIKHDLISLAILRLRQLACYYYELSLGPRSIFFNLIDEMSILVFILRHLKDESSERPYLVCFFQMPS